ncbi:MAG: NADPH-dependent reductase [Nonomuraea muscovyensis]|nr:NADPH-dependent reductase [Nonomuraea muscovyensis]
MSLRRVGGWAAGIIGDMTDVNGLTIGILGGTGDQGKGLARRFAVAGHPVLIGSRNAQRAQEAADSIGSGARGAENAVVAAVLPDSRVVAAFHHVSAVVLMDPSVDKVDLDVLVLGDDREATDLVQALASVIPGVRGVYGGRLRNAFQVEALTANIISVNRRYKAHAGLRITDI